VNALNIKKNGLASDEEINAINERVEKAIAESVKFSEESPWPNDDEVLKDVYVDQNYPFIVDHFRKSILGKYIACLWTAVASGAIMKMTRSWE
jgi:hypothetical protein